MAQAGDAYNAKRKLLQQFMSQRTPLEPERALEG